MKAIIGTVLTSTLLLSACGGVEGDEGVLTQAQGVTGPAFYVDGELYRTVGTPRDLPPDAPDHTFDAIYAVSAYQQYNVAEAAPGQVGFNGGRWKVHAIEIANYAATLAAHDANGSGDLDSNEEIEAALAAGDAVDLGIVRVFECPVIHLP
jgi:hypothetical protein